MAYLNIQKNQNKSGRHKPEFLARLPKLPAVPRNDKRNAVSATRDTELAISTFFINVPPQKR
jgi:hypothetical protein